jgi:hypothetical protein
MRIVQPFAKQHTKTALRTIFTMMSLDMTDEVATRTEEEIGIVVMKTGESIKCETVHGHEDGGGEQRLLVEGNPVDAMVI